MPTAPYDFVLCRGPLEEADTVKCLQIVESLAASEEKSVMLAVVKVASLLNVQGIFQSRLNDELEQNSAVPHWPVDRTLRRCHVAQEGILVVDEVSDLVCLACRNVGEICFGKTKARAPACGPGKGQLGEARDLLCTVLAIIPDSLIQKESRLKQDKHRFRFLLVMVDDETFGPLLRLPTKLSRWP